MESWNKQFKAWFDMQTKYLTKSALARDLGLGKSTVKDYLSGSIQNLDKVSKDAKFKLYQITELDCFKFEGIDAYKPKEELVKEKQPTRKEETYSGIKELLDKMGGVSNNLAGIRQDFAKRFPDKVKEYDTAQASERVIEGLEQVAMYLEPFRIGTKEQRDELIKRLKERGSETYAYIDQMIKIFESGRDMEAFIKLAQPPHILRRIRGKK